MALDGDSGGVRSSLHSWSKVMSTLLVERCSIAPLPPLVLVAVTVAMHKRRHDNRHSCHVP